jgi:hypothetical protein
VESPAARECADDFLAQLWPPIFLKRCDTGCPRDTGDVQPIVAFAITRSLADVSHTLSAQLSRISAIRLYLSFVQQLL